MTARVSDALARIEKELGALWQPDESGSAKPHATTLNLVALHGQSECLFLETLEDVAARLGARTFVVNVDGRPRCSQRPLCPKYRSGQPSAS